MIIIFIVSSNNSSHFCFLVFTILFSLHAIRLFYIGLSVSSLGDNIFILHTTCEQKGDKVTYYFLPRVTAEVRQTCSTPESDVRTRICIL